MHDPSRHIRVDTRLKRAIETGSLPADLLVCGPAGTGKTFAILSILHVLAAENPNLRILLCRRTRVSLTQSALVTFEQEILPADGMESIAAGAGRANRTSYRYPNGSEIVPLGMDNPGAITSSAWDIAFVNESIDLEEASWETISSRLNRPGRDRRFQWLIGDTNPGDPAHWLRKRCLSGRTVLWDTAHKANPGLHDGTDWTPDGVGYMARLGALQGTRRKRYLEGLWAAGDGQWFEGFDAGKHVSESAEYHPAFPVHLAVDSGVHTGGVWFQVRPTEAGDCITVFGDYYAFNRPAHDAAGEIVTRSKALCGGRVDRGTTDPAGGVSSASGITVLNEYKRAGLTLSPWPLRRVNDGLALIDSFLSSDPPGLTVHPRCQHLVDAFGNYKRAKRQGQWIDRPEDPQHPYEEAMDSLRGGLQDKFPQGRAKPLTFRRTTNPLRNML